MDGDRFIEFVLWILSLILAIVFFYNGVNKILATPTEVVQFRMLGISANLLLVVGILECVGGLMLTMPRFALAGGGILGLIMLISAGLHVVHENLDAAIRAMVIFVMLLGICYLRFKRRVVRQ